MQGLTSGEAGLRNQNPRLCILPLPLVSLRGSGEETLSLYLSPLISEMEPITVPTYG